MVNLFLKMRAVFVLCVLVYVVVGQELNDMGNMPKYDSRYDYLDVDAIFTNKRLVRNYVDCLINSVRCSPEGKALKRILPEALRTKCVRCTERQKRAAVKVIRRLKNDFPEEWSKLASRWDPTGDFTRYFEEFLAKESFNTIPGSGSAIPTSSPLAPPRPIPTMPPTIASPAPGPTEPTPPRPAILNRFGEDGELMQGSPSSGVMTPRPMTQATPRPTTTMRSTLNSRPVPPRPTMMTWAGAASNTQPTRFPLRPVSDLPPPYSTAITLIDQIGYKIIKTTELVTDLLRNTVRAVVGR
uniref:Chemosensory protein 4 n=1 Tax=Mythimna separata TaxID=271217 RepID=A0A1V1WC08_MYTSE